MDPSLFMHPVSPRSVSKNLPPCHFYANSSQVTHINLHELCFFKIVDHFQGSSGLGLGLGLKTTKHHQHRRRFLTNQRTWHKANKQTLLHSHFHQLQTFKSPGSSLWGRCPVIWERSVSGPAVKKIFTVGTWWPTERPNGSPKGQICSYQMPLLVHCRVESLLGFGFKRGKSPRGPCNCGNNCRSPLQALSEAKRLK